MNSVLDQKSGFSLATSCHLGTILSLEKIEYGVTKFPFGSD